MDNIVLFGAVYLALGALIGQLHLLRCPSCSSQFTGWAHHAKYIVASAMVSVPMSIIGFLDYWLGACED